MISRPNLSENQTKFEVLFTFHSSILLAVDANKKEELKTKLNKQKTIPKIVKSRNWWDPQVEIFGSLARETIRLSTAKAIALGI